MFVAGILQLWLLIDGVRRNDFTLKLRRPRMTRGRAPADRARHSGRHRGRRHAAQHHDRDDDRFAAAGAVSQLYYADRLYELPLAIVGIAIGVVLLPDVSRHLQRRTTMRR